MAGSEITNAQHSAPTSVWVFKSCRADELSVLRREMSNSSILPRGTACNACRVRKVVRVAGICVSVTQPIAPYVEM